MNSRPNVLFVLSDQHRYHTLPGVAGSGVIAPAMAQLMQQGVSVSNCYSVCPVCTPARGMLMSGRWPIYTGCVSNDCELPPSDTSLGECFTRAGYATGYIGKWHLHHGHGKPDSNCRWIPPGAGRHGFERMTIWNQTNHHWAGHWYDDATGVIHQNERYGATAMTDQAIAQLENWQQHDQRPWMLWLNLNPPHPPLDDAPAECLASYEGRDLPLPPNVPADWTPDRPVPPGAHRPKGQTMPFGQQVRDYHAQVTAVDRELGRLLHTLDTLGVTQNTLVVYHSDHGELLGSHGLLRKGPFYRESMQVPLLMRLPGVIPAGRTCDDLVAGIDVPATMLGLCGIEIPAAMGGLDVSARLRGEGDGPQRKGIVHALIDRDDPRARRASLGLRTRDRLYMPGPRELLFHTDTDYWEQHNKAGDPACEAEAKACSRLLERSRAIEMRKWDMK